MTLYAVERDLSRISFEDFRAAQEKVITLCGRLRRQGKRIRFISSVVDPAQARELCLFGAEGAELVSQVNEACGFAYTRVFPVLDQTPGYVHREMSRRRPWLFRASRAAPPGGEAGREGQEDPIAADAEAIGRWLAQGERLLGRCLRAIRRQHRAEARVRELERDNELLREEMARLGRDMQAMADDREEVLSALRSLAGRVTDATARILRTVRSGGTWG